MPGWHISGGGGGAGGSGDVVGPASSTDNAVARFDLATGKLIQNSDVTISDLAAGAVTISAGKGTAITLKNTDPDATTGASVAGDALSITAGAAVASTDTAGAALGGHVVATGGAAARLTSGNANGGSVIAIGGPGIGTGARGGLGIATSLSDSYIPTLVAAFASTGALDLRRFNTSTNLYDGTYATLRVASLINQADDAAVTSSGLELSTTNSVLFSSTGDYSGPKDASIARLAAGQVAVNNATNGMANNIKIATTTVNASGATSTATNLVPAGCILLGVTTRVTTAITSGDGGTSVNIGNGTDADMYGATIAFALGTTTNLASHTASALAWKAAAESVVFTCVGGTFATGQWRVCAHYLDLTAPTS